MPTPSTPQTQGQKYATALILNAPFGRKAPQNPQRRADLLHVAEVIALGHVQHRTPTVGLICLQQLQRIRDARFTARVLKEHLQDLTMGQLADLVGDMIDDGVHDEGSADAYSRRLKRAVRTALAEQAAREETEHREHLATAATNRAVRGVR